MKNVRSQDLPRHYVIYSHGFGVRKDDRGLFTDIARALPDMHHTMFDYNYVDKPSNDIVVTPLDVQAEMLNRHVNDVRKADEQAMIDIVAHSQGCVATALALPKGIRRVIFLAPPARMLGLEKKEIFALRPNTMTEPDGTLRMPRRDGTTTIIREDYWKSRKGIRPIEQYDQLSDITRLTIITATQDEVLTNTDFSGLSDTIELIAQAADHDFTGDQRKVVCDMVRSLLTS